MKTLWKKYDELTLQCYIDSTKNEYSQERWDEAYNVLTEIFAKAKEEKPESMTELMDFEESIDYQYDIGGWLEEYLGHLADEQLFEKTVDVCQDIIETFEWKKDSPAEFRYRLVAAMVAQKKATEALVYCKVWYEQEEDNPVAASALIEMLTVTEQFDKAEEILQKFITAETPCDVETENLFSIGSYLYERSGDEEKKASIDARMEEYAKQLEQLMSRFSPQDLPF